MSAVYLMKNDLCTVIGAPLKGGTEAERNATATQLPTAVPAKGGPTMAVVAKPLGAKVTEALPLPLGPSGCPQPAARPAAPPSAARAASMLNSPVPPAGLSSFVAVGVAVLVLVAEGLVVVVVVGLVSPFLVVLDVVEPGVASLPIPLLVPVALGPAELVEVD